MLFIFKLAHFFSVSTGEQKLASRDSSAVPGEHLPGGWPAHVVAVVRAAGVHGHILGLWGLHRDTLCYH